MATVSATIIDPFPDFDPRYPAADGSRYVMLDATFEAAGDRGYAANPYEILLRLADGSLVYGQSIPRPYDAPRPLLEGQTMSPGDRISGYIPFIVPADAQVVSVDYQPEGNQRIVIADLVSGGAGPAASPVPSASEAPAATAAPSEPAASVGTAQ
jgi:hypothetical protein